MDDILCEHKSQLFGNFSGVSLWKQCIINTPVIN